MSHWSELVDNICELRGTFDTEFAALERAVDIARGYVRDLCFPLLLQELDEEILDAACFEADALLAEGADTDCLNTPLVMALMFTARGLLYGAGEEGGFTLESDRVEESCRRVGAFVLIEKMRRMDCYTRLQLPFDPWDDETLVVCEGEDRARTAAFKRFLGYRLEEEA